MPRVDLAPAAGEVARLLNGVRDDQLSDPTPCQGTPVAAPARPPDGAVARLHLGGPEDRPSRGRHVTADPGWPGPRPSTLRWRAQLPRRLTELVEAWQESAAWEGMTEAGGVELPAEVMAVVALDELVLHGWDLARATGQTFPCDPASTSAVLAFTRESAQPEQAASREGLFGPVVDVPADSSELDRALGYAGRDPAWTPSTPG